MNLKPLLLACALRSTIYAGAFFTAFVTASCVQMAQAQTASIVFDAAPRESGLHLDTNGLHASSISQDGKDIPTWVSGHKSVPADEWARSFGLTFTDPAFKNGKAPVVEVEIRYWHEANTAVKVMADTQNGSREVASAWGNKKELQTLKFRIEDAYFGARTFGNAPKDLPSDGYDLRINAWAGDFHLASVKVTAIDRNRVSDWTPFLSVGEAKSAKNWVLEPNGSDNINFEVKNSAGQDAKGVARWEVLDLNGKAVRSESQNVVMGAEKTTSLSFDFDAKELPTDEYAVRLSIFLNGADGTLSDTPFFARERSLMIAGPDDVFILFDKEPIARGMEFNREGMSPAEIEVNGAKRWIWRGDATFGSEPWWRSAKFNVTDPRFTGGKRPVTDVRFTYRHVPNAPIWVSGQGEHGPRIIAQEWGNNPGWSTSRVNFDDAKWGAHTNSDDPKKLLPDGADLRLSANSGPVEVRSVLVRGYDLDVPNWTRLIRFDGLDAGRQRFIFSPGEKADIKLKLNNLSNKPFIAHATTALRTDLGEPIWSREQDATLAPRQLNELPVAFDTKDRKQGIYLLDLAMSLGKNGNKLVEQEVNLMVSTQNPVPRVKPGEFLFGLDTGGSWQDDWLLGWANFIGADVLRTSNASLEQMPDALKKLSGLGLATAHMVVPEWKPNADDRRNRNRELAEYGAKVAAAHPEIRYYELGNEPDLTYFYAGSPAEYVEDYIQIRDAIKKANPQAIVMNGGLCFAGEEGDRRAREIIRLMPLEKIDAWAYHGHGPGGQAEQNALEKTRGEAKKWGKDGIPFIETESGVAAGTLVQQRIQARTVIQKFTYAQSQKVPVFHWFRVFISGGDGGYTGVKNEAEARSVMLSYRTTVEQLRGFRFARKVDLGSADYEGYLFVQNGPDGEQNQTGKGRVLVAWANARGGARRLLNLDDARDVARIDMFGNVEGGEKIARVVGLAVEDDPIFLRWNSTAPAEKVRVLPSLLEVAPTIYLAPQSRDTAQITVRNSGDGPLNTQLLVSVPASSGVTPLTKSLPLQLGAGQSKTVSVPLQVSGAPETLVWPRRWMVFPNVVGDKINLSALHAMPGKLEWEGKSVVGQSVSSSDGRIDIAPLGGGVGERKEAILCAEVESPRAQTVQIGASADWYMEWWVNGQKSFSTLEDGNAGAQSLTSHVIPLSLKAGKNLLVVRVQSGSQGWNFLSGGPQELAEAQGKSGGATPNRLTFALQDGAQREPIALESARIAFAGKIAEATTNWNAPSAYSNRKPDALLGDIGVFNPLSVQPDSSKWWQGQNDLSGQMWLQSDANNLYVAFQVRDDLFRPANGRGDSANGDSVRLTLVADEKLLEFSLAGDGTLSKRSGDHWQKMEGKLQVVRVENSSSPSTWYFAKIARLGVPHRFALNAVAIDDDWGTRKQWAPVADGFGEGLNIALSDRQTGDWPRFVFSAGAF